MQPVLENVTERDAVLIDNSLFQLAPDPYVAFGLTFVFSGIGILAGRLVGWPGPYMARVLSRLATAFSLR
jgi:hypothetical protein